MDQVTDWLLDQDPALRWRVERDLLGVREDVWRATRARVATEGIGARLLARQDADGQWAGGAFFPADFDFESAGPGQPWTATTWSLTSLREWGVDAEVLGDTADRLARSSRWEYDDLPYWDGEVDVCINAFTLANGAWLGRDMSPLARWFAEHTMPEGGWNCEWYERETDRASFQSTINAIDGILDYERRTGGTPELHAARKAGEEYLLRRRLLYRLSTGEFVAPWVDKEAYPFRSFYSAVRIASYFVEASAFDGEAPDERIADAIELIRSQRTEDGRWLRARRHPGEVWFEVDVDAGEPSPWVTYHARRALEWWDAAHAL